jgi:hypothetical protein
MVPILGLLSYVQETQRNPNTSKDRHFGKEIGGDVIWHVARSLVGNRGYLITESKSSLRDVT